MLITIISDIHDNLINLKTCLDWSRAQKVEALICCGDLTNDETLEFLALNFQNPIYFVRGNACFFNESEIKKYKHIQYFSAVGRFELADKKIGFCHEPFKFQTVLKLGICEIIFYGHTHKPMEEKKENIRFVNPGTLGGVFQRSTFAVWDTESDNLELKITDLI